MSCKEIFKNRIKLFLYDLQLLIIIKIVIIIIKGLSNSLAEF